MPDSRKSLKSSQGFTPRGDRTYIVFNKPYAVLAQFTRPEGSDKRTLAEFGLPLDVYPVGRLDYDSEGMLILTDDSRLNQLLLDPAHAHERKYWVQVENIPTRAALNHLERGVVIEGKHTAPARARLLDSLPQALPEREKPIRYRAAIPTAWIELTLTEGRNRQVRKMTAAVGNPTLRLFRVQIGQLHLFSMGLDPGEWKEITREDLSLILQRTNYGGEHSH